jgi:hypothetical protein
MKTKELTFIFSVFRFAFKAQSLLSLTAVLTYFSLPTDYIN